MINKTLMWEVIFTRISHPDVTIDVLSNFWTRALGNISVEVLFIDVEMFVVVDSAVIDFDFVVSVSCAVGVLVEVWLDTLTAADSEDVIIVAASDIGVDMFADVVTNVLTVVTADLTFIVPSPLTDSAPSCWAASICWPIADLECARAVQALIPSCQVWPSLALPAPPQFLNQEPPRPQQLLRPDFAMVPHLEHANPRAVVVVAAVYVWALIKHTKIQPYSLLGLS